MVEILETPSEFSHADPRRKAETICRICSVFNCSSVIDLEHWCWTGLQIHVITYYYLLPIYDWIKLTEIVTPNLLLFIRDSLSEPPITIPGFGKEKCYFQSKQAQIPYLYFPAGILLLVDFIFFASTVLHLRKMHTHTELARTQSTSSMEDKKG